MTSGILVNAALGGTAVTVGLWMLLGDLSLSVTLLIIAVLTVLLLKISPSISHVWAWTTFLLGLESLAWPFLTMGSLPEFGEEPPLEDMKRVFTAVLFGLFSGVFWLTFSYGIYRRITNTLNPVETTHQKSSMSKAKRKKMRQGLS